VTTATALANPAIVSTKQIVAPAELPSRSERAQALADAKAARKKTKADAPLRLSLSAGDLATLPTANESVRAELRRRQLILDTDNLMSALLERNHKIGLLEKELAGLTARVSAAERSLNIPQAPATAADLKSVSEVSVPPVAVAQPVAQQVPEAVIVPAAPVIAAAESAKPPARIAPPQQVEPSARSFAWWSVALLSIALLSIVVFVMARRRREVREEVAALAPQEINKTVEEIISHEPKPVHVSPQTDLTEKAVIPAALVAPTVVDITATAFPEIEFELPETTKSPVATQGKEPLEQPRTTVEGTAGTAFHLPSQAANSEAHPIPEDIRGRRMRYLQSRYHDIAILMPPLDAPLRLLKQAGRIHDEGAVDYAKRLLKYAVYSRPYTEEFWLGLLELLYREKFANDYLVNAKWFREYHPESSNWDEIQRIGYLLDPGAPLFSNAAAWSHEEPIMGTWLPANQASATHTSARPQLKLELAS
jgi:hypothetical protein